MFVMHMAMLMLQNLVPMFVFVSLGQMQPKTAIHEQPRQRQLRRKRLAEKQDRDDCSNEWRQRKIGPVRAVPRCRSASMNKIRLTPTPRKPTIAAAPTFETDGNAEPTVGLRARNVERITRVGGAPYLRAASTVVAEIYFGSKTVSITWITPLEVSMSALITLALLIMTPFIASTEISLPWTVLTIAFLPAISDDITLPGTTW